MSTNTHLPQFPMNGTELECGGEELRLDGTCARCERVNERIESKITTARKEAREEAFKDAVTTLVALPAQGTMNYRRGYEEGVRDAIRTLEAAATTRKGENHGG